MKCNNCKKKYKFVKSEDRYFKVKYEHKNPLCSFQKTIYGHNENQCKKKAQGE